MEFTANKPDSAEQKFVTHATDRPPSANSPTPAAPSAELGQPSAGTKDDPLRGFGGWLILLILILLVLFPLQTIVGVIANVAAIASGGLAESVIYLILVDVAVGVSLMCYGFYSGLKLLKVKPGAVSATKTFLVALFAYNCLKFALTLVAEHQGIQMEDAVTAELRNVVFALFWWVYLEMSKRVAATYSDIKA